MSDLFSDHIFSVEDLTSLIKQTLEGSFQGLSVEGEISNFRPAASGHWYFQLNDAEASLQAVMFKQKSWRLPFMPKDGDRVVVTGSISVYAKRGTYQIICETMRKSGVGDLLLLLEKRKQEFAAAGYFDPERKRPLPEHPKRIGVVTSPTGAALQDILKTLQRRNRMIDIVVLPALVQGDGAARTIAAQIEAANRFGLADVLIVGRGGGSLEDLLPFSEKIVVEAIVASRIPVVSAVGHEIDWALSDYAADIRASTPTAAAELISTSWEQLVDAMQGKVQSLGQLMHTRIMRERSKAALVSPGRMHEYVKRKIELAQLTCDDIRQGAKEALEQRLRSARHAHQLAKGQLESLSPMAVLRRGFAIVTSAGTIVRSAAALSEGELLHIRFAEGSAQARTEKFDHVGNKGEGSR